MPFFQETLHFLFIILKRDIGDFYLIPFTARQKYNNSLFFEFFSENIFQFGISYLDLGFKFTPCMYWKAFHTDTKSYPV